jgi:hypothetical protein
MRTIIGGCLCGKIRYSAVTDPAIVAVCHCKHCQKQGGTAFSVVVAVPRVSMKLEGPIKTYHDIGGSGQPVERHFCPECGSPITTDATVAPELTFIKAGTLDDTSWLDPKVHIYCDSAQTWTPIPESSQKFAKMPS